MGKILVILEVSGKQDYIFQSKKLQDNVRNSAEIAWITGSDFFAHAAGSLYSEEKNLVYSGGGHAVLQFDSSTQATAFSRAVSETVIRELDGPELFIRQLEWDPAAAPGVNLKNLTKELERKKSLRRSAFRQTTFGIEELNRASWKPVRQGPASGSSPKLPELPEGVQEPEGWSFAKSFDQLLEDSVPGTGTENFIAVVHIDGNSMGKRVSGIYQQYQDDWELCCEALRSFSAGIQHDFSLAFNEMAGELTGRTAVSEDGEKVLPLRPIILAGDDVCYAVSGKLALESAAIYLAKLAEKSNEMQLDQPYSACAGIALVHLKYPFYQAYALAEQLCENAKHFGAEIDPDGGISAMDWHIEFGQLKERLSDIRRDYTTEDGSRMELRPLAVVVPDRLQAEAAAVTEKVRTWEYFSAMCRQLTRNQQQRQVPRSKLKELREALRQGVTESRFYLQDREIRGLLYNIGFDAEFRTSEARTEVFRDALTGAQTGTPSRFIHSAFRNIHGTERCLYFDAIEIMDQIALNSQEDEHE